MDQERPLAITIAGSLLIFAVVACSVDKTPLTITGTPTPTAVPQATGSKAIPTLTPAAKPISAPTVTSSLVSTDTNPYHLSAAQLSRVGDATEPYVAKRQVVVQRFERGAMLIFAKAGNVFDQRGGEFIFALANDGRA